MKVLIKVHHEQIDIYKNGYNIVATYLQSIVDEFNKFRYDVLSVDEATNEPKYEELTINELQQMFIDFECLMFDKMTKGQPVTLLGFEVHKHEAMKLIKKPAEYDVLSSLVKNIEVKIKPSGGVLPYGFTFSTSEIAKKYAIENNIVVVTQEAIDKLENMYKRYAETPKAIKMYEFGRAIIEAYNRLGIKDITSNPTGIGHLISTLLKADYWQAGNKDIEINEKTIVACNSTEGAYV